MRRYIRNPALYLAGPLRGGRARQRRVPRAVRAFIRTHGASEWYLWENPDVAGSGIDPVAHWYLTGFKEGRRFPGIRVDPPLAAADGVSQRTGVPSRDLLAIDESIDVERKFMNFVETHGDAAAYMARNGDVVAAGLDPIRHWLQSGLSEGRQYPGIEARLRSVGDANGWERLAWRGEQVHIRIQQPLPDSVVAQLLSQSLHEPALLAPGEKVVAKIRRVDATNLYDRDGFDGCASFDQVKRRRRTVVIIPSLGSGGAEKYAAALVDELRSNQCNDVLVIVSDQSASQALDKRTFQILSPLFRADILFLRDFVRDTNQFDETTLARFLYAIAPDAIFVINSEISLRAVAKYGRSLRQNTQVYCAFFSLDPGTHGSRYAERVATHSRFITDNRRTAAELTRRFRYGALESPICIPPRVQISMNQFEARLRERLTRQTLRYNRTRNGRWLWVSRIATLKGTAILQKLAMLRPDDQFEVFGPVDDQEALRMLAGANVSVHPPVLDTAVMDLREYTGFIFTSLSEGMPNIVLEMSQHALPIVVADVGGLRETFTDESVFFVGHQPDEMSTAMLFSESLLKVLQLSDDELSSKLQLAQAQVAERHGAGAFSREVKKLLVRKIHES